MKRSEDRLPSHDVAIAEIVDSYSSKLRSYIRGQVGCREDAEDILQEVFYQLARSMQSDGGGIENVSAWLYRVARNSILNLWRKCREESLPSIDEDGIESACKGLSDMLFSTSADEPENVYLRKLVWQELEYALAELPPEQSEVFCLTVFDGIPVKDISARTGIPVATLLSRKHYAVKFLRIRLRGLYEDLLNY